MKAGTIFFLTDQVRLEGRMWYSSNGTDFQSAGIRDCFSLQVTNSAVFTTQLHVSTRFADPGLLLMLLFLMKSE